MTGVGAAAALAVNRRLVDAETRPPEPDGGRIVHVDACDVHVVEHGPRDAPPVVLLHGFAGSMRWFDRLWPLLGERRVIMVDLPGHGGSEKPDISYAIADHAAVVTSVLRDLAVERAEVVGHAMGAAVAAALAETESGAVERLVLINEGPDNTFVSAPLIARLGFQPVIGELLHRVVNDGMVRDGYRDAFAEGFDLADGFPDPDQVVSDFRRMTYSAYKRSWEQEDAYLAEKRLDHRVRDLGLPALVIFGERDRFFRAAESAAAFRAIPGVRVEMLPGSGHSPQVEQPEAVAALVADFGGGAAARSRDGGR